MEKEAARQLLPVISALLVADNDVRGAAERSFEAAVHTEPRALTLALLSICGEWTSNEETLAAEVAVRSLCGVLLRRHLCSGNEPLWPRLDLETRLVVREVLARAMTVQPPARWAELGKRLGECAAELFRMEPDEWKELIPACLAAVEANCNLQGACDALRTIARTLRNEPNEYFWGPSARVIGAALERSLMITEQRRFLVRALAAVLVSSPNDVNAQVEGAATELFVRAAFFVPCEDLSKCLQSSDPAAASREAERSLREGLEQLLEVSEEKSRLLTSISVLSPLCESCLRLATECSATEREEELLSGSRTLALELMVSLCETAAPAMRKCQLSNGRPFAAQAIEAAFALVCTEDTEVYDEQAYCLAEYEDPELVEPPSDQTTPSGLARRDMGAEALARLSEALRPRAVLPRACVIMRDLLARASTGDWRAGRAGFCGLVQLAAVLIDEDDGDEESSSKRKSIKKKKKKPEVYALLLDDPESSKKRKKVSTKTRRRDAVEASLRFATGYPVAAVRRAALDSLAQLSEDWSPYVQMELHDVIMPALCASLDRERPEKGGSLRCRAAASRALVHFLDSAIPSVVEPYLETLAAALAEATTPTTVSLVRENTVAAVAALASSLEERTSHSRTLYAIFAPSLKPLCSRQAPSGPNLVMTETSATLRARSLECLALLGSAAGRDVFAADALELLRVVTTDYFGEEASRRPEDEAERAGALRSVVRVAKCLGADFAPFLETTLRPLLQAAKGEHLVVMHSSGNDSCSDDDSDDDSDEEEETCVVRTEALEEQATACRLVLVLAEAMGRHFAPYAADCCVSLAPLACNALADDVRAYAMAALPTLVKCIALEEHHLSGNPDLSRTRSIMCFASQALLEALRTESDLEPMLTALQALRQTLEDACRILTVDEGSSEVVVRATPETSVPLLLLGADVSPRLIFMSLRTLLNDSIQRRAIRKAQQTVNEDDDEEDVDGLEAKDEELHFNISECVGAVLRTHGVAAFADLEVVWLERVLEMAHPYCLEVDRKFASFILADTFEFGLSLTPGSNMQLAAATQTALGRLLEPLLAMARDRGRNATETEARRQAATYGLGVAAQKCDGEAFAAHAPLIAEFLCSVVNRDIVEDDDIESDSEEDDFETDEELDEEEVASPGVKPMTSRSSELVTDNACASLLHLLARHSQSLQLRSSAEACEVAWSTWLRYLPLRADAEEADRCAHALCEAMQQPAFAAQHCAQGYAALARTVMAIPHGASDTTAFRASPCSSAQVRLKAARDERAARGIPDLATHVRAALAVLATAPGARDAFNALPDNMQHALTNITNQPSTQQSLAVAAF